MPGDLLCVQIGVFLPTLPSTWSGQDQAGTNVRATWIKISESDERNVLGSFCRHEDARPQPDGARDCRPHQRDHKERNFEQL